MCQHGHALQVWLRLLTGVMAAPGARAVEDLVSRISDIVGQLNACSWPAFSGLLTPLDLPELWKALHSAYPSPRSNSVAFIRSLLACTPDS